LGVCDGQERFHVRFIGRLNLFRGYVHLAGSCLGSAPEGAV
jgi:hypothetical protein